MNAKNVLVDGMRIVGAPMFVVHLLYTENATVRNVMIEAYPGPHANGIVADSSRFVRISDAYIDTGDDGIVLKSGKDADGLRVNRADRACRPSPTAPCITPTAPWSSAARPPAAFAT